MQNSKSLQTKNALISILNDLYEEDHFALILFDNGIVTWKDSLTKATRDNVDEGTIYVRQLSAAGGKRKLMASIVMSTVLLIISFRSG